MEERAAIVAEARSAEPTLEGVNRSGGWSVECGGTG